MMHVDNHLAEIESYTRAMNMHTAGVVTLVEPVKDMLETVGIKT